MITIIVYNHFLGLSTTLLRIMYISTYFDKGDEYESY